MFLFIHALVALTMSRLRLLSYKIGKSTEYGYGNMLAHRQFDIFCTFSSSVETYGRIFSVHLELSFLFAISIQSLLALFPLYVFTLKFVFFHSQLKFLQKFLFSWKTLGMRTTHSGYRLFSKSST